MKPTSRRDFLKKASVIGAASLAGVACSCSKKGPQLVENWHLNPAFQINSLPDNSIELYCYDGNGNKIAYEFSGLEADMLLAISQKSKLEEQISTFTQKFNCTEQECRKQMIGFLKDQQESKIIYSGKEMLVFKREKNG